MVEGQGASILTSCMSNCFLPCELKAEFRNQWNFASIPVYVATMHVYNEIWTAVLEEVLLTNITWLVVML